MGSRHCASQAVAHECYWYVVLILLNMGRTNTTYRNVHDGKYTSSLFHLHGLHPLQDTRRSRHESPTCICPLRNAWHIRSHAPSQGCVHSLQHDDVGARNMEGQRNGLATNDEIRLVGVGEREDVVRKSGTKGVVVVVLFA